MARDTGTPHSADLRNMRGMALRVIVVLAIMASLVIPPRFMGSVEGAPAREVRVAAIYSIPNPARAGGFDRGHFLGGLDLINKFKWRLAVAEDVPFPRLAETAAGYAEAGYDIVIFTSSGHIAAWNEVAPKYPRTRFVLMSVIDKLPEGRNVAAYSPDLQAYGAMVGATAAMLTRTGKIGVVSGAPVLGVVIAFSALIEAAKVIRPDIEVLTAFSGDWADLPRAREATTLHIRRGADVIFTIHGPPTTAVLAAAEAGKVHAIGYATDFYRDSPGSVVTSVLMNHHRWYERLANDFLEGRMDRAHVIFGAETFGLADFRGSIPPAQESRIRDTVARIQRGELKFPFRMHELGR